MAQQGFYVDIKRCLGCMACQVACKDKFDMEAGEFGRRALHARRVVIGRLAAAQDHVAVLVAHGLEDGGLAEAEQLRIQLDKHLGETQAQIPEPFDTPAWRWAAR